jgi:hypothetical protein
MNAILVTGIYIVSIFNVQLGAPILSFVPMTTMNECERLVPHFTGDQKIDIEWTMYMRSQCLTMNEYQERVRAMEAAQRGEVPGPQKPQEQSKPGGE